LVPAVPEVLRTVPVIMPVVPVVVRTVPEVPQTTREALPTLRRAFPPLWRDADGPGRGRRQFRESSGSAPRRCGPPAATHGG
jgi:hypothetical protein